MGQILLQQQLLLNVDLELNNPTTLLALILEFQKIDELTKAERGKLLVSVLTDKTKLNTPSEALTFIQTLTRTH